MKKTETSLAEFWVIIYITSKFRFCKNLRISFSIKTNICFTHFWVITYKTGKFSCHEKNRNVIDTKLSNKFT